MYVTRRFLRSTMAPPEPAAASEQNTTTATTERTRARASPSATPRVKRQSSSADAMPVAKVAVASAAALMRKKKPSPRLSRSTEPLHAPTDEENEQKPLAAGLGLLVDARDSLERWCEAKIIDLDEAARTAFVHYVGWNARHDAWLSVAFLAAHGSHTGSGERKPATYGSSSWDGCAPLFATAEEQVTAAVEQRELETRVEERVMEAVDKKKDKKGKKKDKQDKKTDKQDKKDKKDKKKDRKKKRHSRKRSDGSEHSDGDGDGAAADEREPRKRPRVAENNASVDLPPSQKPASAPPVRVAVATTDEASERKARRDRKAAVDLELHVKAHEDSASEASASAAVETAESEDAESEDARTSKKPRRQRASSSSKASVSASKRSGRGGGRQPQLPPVPRSPVVLSETREKLAAIFRLRLQQRQHLEQLMSADADSSAGSESLAPPAAEAETADTAAQEAYAHYHHAQQLQQFYYQQAMLATSADASNRDANGPALQGGLVDPRVIQARVDALELQRRMQQQQLHDFYQHVAIARERNVQALASTHDFLAKSSHAWHQQQQAAAAGERDEKKPAEGAGCATSTSAGGVLYEFVL